MNPQRAPFADATTVRGLYATARRQAARTRALHQAKITGRHAADVIADLAAAAVPASPVAADVGCGRGSTTRRLTQRLAPKLLVAIDQSPAMLAAATARLDADTPTAVRLVCADFHRLPLADATLDLVVAAFCLYHSPTPVAVLTELARCLRPGGAAILATKAADSYQELDALMATSGLDPHATMRPSLYTSAHSANLADLTAAAGLTVTRCIHELHRFRFADLAHAAAYLATSPKYALPARLGDPDALAAALRARLPDGPVAATSTVTYLTATHPPHGRDPLLRRSRR